MAPPQCFRQLTARSESARCGRDISHRNRATTGPRRAQIIFRNAMFSSVSADPPMAEIIQPDRELFADTIEFSDLGKRPGTLAPRCVDHSWHGAVRRGRPMLIERSAALTQSPFPRSAKRWHPIFPRKLFLLFLGLQPRMRGPTQSCEAATQPTAIRLQASIPPAHAVPGRSIFLGSLWTGRTDLIAQRFRRSCSRVNSARTLIFAAGDYEIHFIVRA